MKEQVSRKNQISCQLFANSKGWLSVAVFSMAILSAYNIVISWLLQKIIDIAAGTDPAPLSFVLIIAIVTFIVFIFSYGIYRTARPRFLQAAMTQYKAGVFEKILEKKIGSFSKEGTGRLISALTNDMRLIEDHYLDTILEFVDIGVSFAGALLLMLWYDPLLTLCSILFSILPILVSIAPSRKLAEAEKRLSDGNAAYVGIIKDILSGFAVIKSFQAEKQIRGRFETDNIKIEAMKFQRRYAEENVNLLSTAASVMMRLGIFMAGAWMAVSGTGVTPGTVLVFLQLVTFVIAPIEKLPARLANRKAAIAVMDRLSAFLSLTDEVPVSAADETPNAAPAETPNVLPGKSLPHALTGAISVRGLSFSYEKGKEILKHIDLDFRAGKKYAIVGGSGSGKTTFLNLLMQTTNDYEGRILFDGTELRRIPPDVLFGALSLVQQNVFVFQDTLYHNITLYKSFSDSDFQSAVSAAGLSELLSSRGRDYLCGENGNALSGGEKQRISIARALLRKSSVLLMDEATAALDEITAKEIMNSILDMENITRIIVTHRLDENTMKQYDEIIVLNHGRVSEQGTFAQLIAKRGLFYSLFTVSQSA